LNSFVPENGEPCAPSNDSLWHPARSVPGGSRVPANQVLRRKRETLMARIAELAEKSLRLNCREQWALLDTIRGSW